MAVNLPDAPELVTASDPGNELASFVRAMRANSVSTNTVTAHGGAVRQYGAWVMAHDFPTDVERIEARHVEQWIGELLERNKRATAHNR